MTLWETVTWSIARSGGVVAFILLTLAVTLGLALSTQLQSPGQWPRLVNNELHNFLTLLALIFVGIHVLAVWLDPYTHFGLNEILIPLASHYRPFWVALGIIGLYLGLAIGLSTWIRPLIGYKWWRRMHISTIGIYVLVVIHGIMSGTDAAAWWALLMYLASIALVGGMLIRRIFLSPKARNRPKPASAPNQVHSMTR